MAARGSVRSPLARQAPDNRQMYSSGRFPSWGAQTGGTAPRAGNLPTDLEGYAAYIQQFPGAAPGGSGYTGLAPGDDQGWQHLQQLGQAFNAAGGRGPAIRTSFVGGGSGSAPRSGGAFGQTGGAFGTPGGKGAGMPGLQELERLIGGGRGSGGGLGDLMGGAQRAHVGANLGATLAQQLDPEVAALQGLGEAQSRLAGLRDVPMPQGGPPASEDVWQNLPQARQAESAIQALQAQLTKAQSQVPGPPQAPPLDPNTLLEIEADREGAMLDALSGGFESGEYADPQVNQQILQFIMQMLQSRTGGAGAAAGGGGY